MKIALFGATGNIGKRILAKALNRGHQVKAIIRDTTKLPAGQNLEVNAIHALKGVRNSGIKWRITPLLP